jgi:hypothetical protein
MTKQQITAVFDVDNTPERTLRFSFAEFLQQPLNEPLKDQLLYQKYYSRAAIDRGATEFYVPDLQPLPSILVTPSPVSMTPSPSTLSRLRSR